MSASPEATKETRPSSVAPPTSSVTSTSKRDSSPPPDSAVAVLQSYGYTLGESLGKGSYAVVKAAYSQKHKKRVAIKIVSKRRAPDDYLTKFLPREIQVMKRLRHPNCVCLYEAIETSSRIYLVMDMADNGDLLEHIRSKGALSEEKARGYFRQLIDATAYMHDRDIVHRDLKCENLLLTQLNAIMISDFGFSRVQAKIPDSQKRKLSRTFCGSYAYAPPEILRGIAYDGTMADIWSLGVVLFTMVCASLPFDDSNLKILLEQVSKRVQFPRKRGALLTTEVKNLIGRMLTSDVSERIDIEGIRNDPWFRNNKTSTVSISEVDPSTTSTQSNSHEDESSHEKKKTTCSPVRASEDTPPVQRMSTRSSTRKKTKDADPPAELRDLPSSSKQDVPIPITSKSQE
ncbi:testis-specific serine/threonine-protein kinase 3-like [Xenia sp. Carnegie-2017]|uniref:testis-specific serine/threonine-protein kinase 3-like n=1 Tax=Xenia sp. Carnegie-2017 TaxID=2897299 RepID=UPI001F038D09|nr:testis-specific serine/threonine-protein kinase 3-like [Xenia sp. Carnegie-2017]